MRFRKRELDNIEQALLTHAAQQVAEVLEHSPEFIEHLAKEKATFGPNLDEQYTLKKVKEGYELHPIKLSKKQLKNRTILNMKDL